jgi:hypothetical protein
MKRFYLLLVAAGLCTAVVTAARAQMGMDFFKRPAIASLFKPVIGNGAIYESTRAGETSASKEGMEIIVVGRELADGKEAYWLEIGHEMKGFEGKIYNKVLVSGDDFKIHRTIMQLPGHPAMEMRANPSSHANKDMEEQMNKWSQVGSETITVPAGTFSCQHWKKNDGKGEIWSSDKVSPFGMVKEIDGNSTNVLVKVITGAKDHITGPVSPFDPQAFRQLMMEQMMKEKQQNP